MSGDEHDALWDLLHEYGEASAPGDEATQAAWSRLEASAGAAARPELGGDPSSSIWTRGHSTWRLAMAAGISVAVGVGAALAATAYLGGFDADPPTTSTSGGDTEGSELDPTTATEAEVEALPEGADVQPEPEVDSCETACAEWAAQRSESGRPDEAEMAGNELAPSEPAPDEQRPGTTEAKPKLKSKPKSKKKAEPVPTPPSTDEEAGAALAAERRVLSRAQSALSKGFFAEAERHLAEHARDYEHGLLEDLRLGLQAIVACKRGKTKRGAQRLAQLRKRFPSAPILARAEAACSE